MKKILTIILTITLFPLLYAQEAEPAPQPEPDEGALENWNRSESFGEDEKYDTVDEFGGELQPKSKVPDGMGRRYFELGFDMRIGFDNGLIGIGDSLKKNIIIDLDKIENSIRDGGLNVNADGNGDILYMDILNIKIIDGLWDFGFFINTEGTINVNTPKSLFTLISQGNVDQRSYEGMISASGGVYANTGLNASAKYGKLRVGLKPTLFTPLIFIPMSGITYHLETEDDVDLTSSGEIIVYYPLDENKKFVGLNFGFDISLDGEYALFPFLDIGGSFSRIPLAPATLQNRMKLGMSDLQYHLDGKKIMEGTMDEMPNFGKFDDPIFDMESYKVYRPFRLDVYVRYKPFSTEILAVRPNIGFSVDNNDNKRYFNAGLEVQSMLLGDVIKLYMGTGYQETIWRHRVGCAFNFRGVELGFEGALRADSFPGSFRGQGFAAGLSARFGW